MDLGDTSARKLHHRRIPMIRCVRARDDLDAGPLRLSQRPGEVCDLVPGRLPSVGIRQMAVCYQGGQPAESRRDPCALASSEMILPCENARKLRVNAAAFSGDTYARFSG